MASADLSGGPASPTSPFPPPVHHADHQHRHGILGATSSTFVMVVVPLASVLLFVVAVSILLILRRVRSAGKAHEGGGGIVGHSSNSLSKRLPSNLSSYYAGANGDPYSPDVRRCIYGGNLGFPFQPKNKRGQVFTYRELETAADGFREENVIGNGGFGVVYRGTLADGTVAAIKMLKREGKQGEREFRMEVDLLSRLHSPYLVGLIGYCADQHHRLLVFEYMPNGCLQRHLHPTSSNSQQHVLDWCTRLRIALDCARALEFLHEHTVPAVIHRDYKCSNILLDQNYRAKVSDFGMAKIGSDKINGQVLTRVLGTTGYVAPEYALTGKLTTKSDVYSFGVVLLELLTGRVPVDIKRPPGEDVLVPWALPRLTNRQKVVEMVDPALQGRYSKKDLIQIAAIAAVCVQSESDYRPLMTDVVQSLIPLVRSPSGTCPTTPSRFSAPVSKFNVVT
ncbi:hypothetical protein Taro_016940 [Colocasia esculenta]|uniref:Protein kinase domain-containing protein n=1 Tax=Colocasia esculenta TaxID=4460 RepID=A0A843ULS3_COLES|nr:hypothetical protein [Colocasia esculenta]